jgi:hypothetical protein
MGDMFTSKNLKMAGIVGLAAYLAMALTASQNKLIQGAAVVAAAAAALPLAAKL